MVQPGHVAQMVGVGVIVGAGYVDDDPHSDQLLNQIVIGHAQTIVKASGVILQQN